MIQIMRRQIEFSILGLLPTCITRIHLPYMPLLPVPPLGDNKGMWKVVNEYTATI